MKESFKKALKKRAKNQEMYKMNPAFPKKRMLPTSKEATKEMLDMGKT